MAYEDLTGDGSREIIVSWQLSTGVHSLSVHSFGVNSANELMSATYNEGYMTVDLDEDGGQELLVFQRDITGDPVSRMLPLLTVNSAPKNIMDTATPRRTHPAEPLMNRNTS